MNDDRVEQLRPDRNLQQRRHFGIGPDLVILHDTGTINMTALAYLFRNISDFYNLADRFRLRNKRPATGAANQYARSLQLAESSVRGHARYVELLHQFSFRRNTVARSEEHTSELQSLMRRSYAVCCLKK